MKTMPGPKLTSPFGSTVIIKYPNTKPGSDLLRLQVQYSLMDKHNELNINGKVLADFIQVAHNNKTWNKERGAVILIKNNKILLMERHRYDNHFFELPGGTQNQGEDVIDTALREGIEETNLKFELTNDDPIVMTIESGRKETNYFTTEPIGEPYLGKEESGRRTKHNRYDLVWVDLDKITTINFRPEGLAKQILERLKI